MYGFPPLEDEVKLFCDELSPEGFDWTEFEAALDRLRVKTADFAKSAKEYDSYGKMQADRYKNIRVKGELQDKYKMPMTSSQTYGFYHADDQQKEITKMVSFPIHQCTETKFADHMLKTGFPL